MYLTIYRNQVIWFGDEEECINEASEYRGAKIVRFDGIISIDEFIKELKDENRINTQYTTLGS